MATTALIAHGLSRIPYSAHGARIGRENIAFARSLGLTNARFTGSQVIFSPVRTAMSQRRLMMSLRTASAMFETGVLRALTASMKFAEWFVLTQAQPGNQRLCRLFRIEGRIARRVLLSSPSDLNPPVGPTNRPIDPLKIRSTWPSLTSRPKCRPYREALGGDYAGASTTTGPLRSASLPQTMMSSG